MGSVRPLSSVGLSLTTGCRHAGRAVAERDGLAGGIEPALTCERRATPYTAGPTTFAAQLRSGESASRVVICSAMSAGSGPNARASVFSTACWVVRMPGSGMIAESSAHR